MRKLLPLLAVLILIVLGFYIHNKQKASILSYEDCVKAGNQVLDSYPSRCSANGKTYTQRIESKSTYAEELLISNPKPNQAVMSPLAVFGKAKGTWFFEGSFPAELFDANNKSLGKVAMSAQGDWMTEDMVDFTGNIIFTKPETKTGTLVLKNDNPSGLKENERKISIPVSF